MRGYGLVDSPKVDGEPGKQLNLTAVPAPNDAAAAALLSGDLLVLDAEDPGGGPVRRQERRIPENVKQIDWINLMKNNGCVGCHQLGTLATRTIPAFFGNRSKDAWMQRIAAGQAGELMVNIIAEPARRRAARLSHRLDRPHRQGRAAVRPSRSGRQGSSATSWSRPGTGRTRSTTCTTSISTDRRNPTVNADGPVYGQPEYSMGYMPILDPKTNTATMFKAPIRDPNMHENLGPGHAAMEQPLGPSAYWGEEKIWEAYFNNHNSMLDEKGRVWMTASFRDEKNAAGLLQASSDHPSAKLVPARPAAGASSRSMIPKTQKYDFVDTCFTTHHLNFAYDANNTLWTSSGGGGGVVGWVNIKKWDETHDAGEVAGLDRADRRHQRRRQARRIHRAGPAAGAGQGHAPRPGVLCRVGEPEGRLGLGHDPQQSRRDRAHQSGLEPARDGAHGSLQCPDAGLRSARRRHRLERRVLGVARLSGHIGSFDRTKCKGPLNGPNATGNHCPEGWTFYKYPGPGFAGIGDNSAESSYYSWVDQHNTFGLGKDVPMSTANLMDGLVALKDGKMVSLRVPYPMGFFAKGLDGRIDDPNAGWKGRGLWTSSGDRAPWQVEGGKGMKPMAVHFQLRPDPLAK